MSPEAARCIGAVGRTRFLLGYNESPSLLSKEHTYPTLAGGKRDEDNKDKGKIVNAGADTEHHPSAHFSLRAQLSTASGLSVVSPFSSTGSPRGTRRSLGNAASIRCAQKQDKKGIPLSLQYKPRVSLRVISDTSSRACL